MKGLQTGIPIALLAAAASAQVQDNGGNNAAIPISNFYNDQSLEIENKGSPGSHHSPPIHARPGQSGPGGAARHPPMAHASAPRAVRPDDDGEQSSVVPTCSTQTVVHTVTQTVSASSYPSYTPHPYGVAGGYGDDDDDGSSDSWGPGYDGYGKDGDSYDPAYGYDPVYGYGDHGAASSSAAHVPLAQSSAAQSSPVVNGPAPYPSAAYWASRPVSSTPVAWYPGPTPRPSSWHNPSSVHGGLVDAIPVSTSVAHAAMTSTAVHGAQSYNVIPVDVPNASKSSVRLHGSSSATPSSSAGPSGVDPNRAHGTIAANPSSSSVAFTGGAAHLAPTAGMVTAFCGLLGLMAYAL